MRLLFALMFVLAAGPALAAELTPNTMLDWSGEEGAEQVFTAGDLTLTLKLSGDESEKTATLSIAKPGADPVEVSGLGAGTGYGQVGVVSFDSNGMRSVLFAVYAGGAHCCMQTTAVTETAGGWVTAEVGTFDGDSVQPEDLDSDGIYELAQRDDRFNYAFDAYAFSYAPPMILKSRDGAVYDASAEPQFRPVFETMLADAKQSCSGETWNLGACAGVLGAAARLGTYEAEAAPIFAALAAGKKTSGWDEFQLCTNTDCSETKTIADFPTAIETALRDWGYLPATQRRRR